VTDRQTDRRTDRRRELRWLRITKAVAAFARKKCNMLKRDSNSMAMGQIPRSTERISSYK